MDINKVLAEEFKLRQDQIDNTIALFDDGKTIPFVARYRKEATGSLDDQILREIFDRMTYLRNLEKRKEEVSATINEQGKLTDEITAALSNAETLSDDDLDRYMSEFEIWQDASGENKRKMWPTRTKSYTDFEEREDSLPR